MMLSIEELKALSKGEWVWIVNKETGEGYYAEVVTQAVTVFAIVSVLNHYSHNYDNYGKGWEAYRNKQEAELSNYVDLHCHIMDKVWYLVQNNAKTHWYLFGASCLSIELRRQGIWYTFGKQWKDTDVHFWGDDFNKLWFIDKEKAEEIQYKLNGGIKE